MLKKIINPLKTMGMYHGCRFIVHSLGIKLFKFNLFEDFYHYQSYKYLKKKYRKFDKWDVSLKEKNLELDSKCWIMWWQGENKAPEIVKKCITSIKKNSTNFEVILLSKENIRDYVELPDRIWNLFNKNKISFAHFSDIVRTYLLYFYGGLWIDATCLMTDNVPDSILESDIFFFQDTIASITFLPISNWFIYAKNPKNYVLKKLLYGLLFYWDKNSNVCDYFIYHTLFKYFFENDYEFKRIVETMPYFCNATPHVLQKNLFVKFDEKKWDLILSSSFCHKLTYKYKIEDLDNTFLNYVLSNKEGV